MNLNSHTLFAIICIILASGFLLDQFLDFLNYRNMKPELPESLRGIYDQEKYSLSQKYERSRSRFGFIVSSFDFAVIMAMLIFGGFAYVDTIARSITGNTVLVTLIFFGIIIFASDIIKLPFSLYSTFVIEEKFGFNKMTLATFFGDKIKGWILTVIIGGGLLSAVTYFYLAAGSEFWLYAWILFTAFSVILTMTYSTVIVPLFNKQTPLPEGELRQEIEEFSKTAGFTLDRIYEIDGSKRSTKANAYFTGFGSKKRIVLFDTLIREMTTREIVAVLAHEIGHYKKKHVITGLITGILQMGALLFIFSLFANNPLLSQSLGAENHSFHMAVLAFGILFTPINLVLGIVMNILSRRNEFQADRFAKEKYSGHELAGALKKLSVKNLSNLTPHPLYVFFHYSHPPVLARIERLEN